MKFLILLGWIFIPYVMIFVRWKKLGGVGKTLGTIWGIIALLMAINTFNSEEPLTADEPAASESKEVVQASAKPKEEKVKEAPEVIELSNEGVSSDVTIVVNGMETSDTIGDNQFATEEAQGVFKIIEVTLTNGQKDAITVDANSYTLIDDQEREFSYSSEAQIALMSSVDEKKEPFFLQKLNPGLSITGYIVFDVPADAKGFTLEARGGMTGKKIVLKVE